MTERMIIERNREGHCWTVRNEHDQQRLPLPMTADAKAGDVARHVRGIYPTAEVGMYTKEIGPATAATFGAILWFKPGMPVVG